MYMYMYVGELLMSERNFCVPSEHDCVYEV